MAKNPILLVTATKEDIDGFIKDLPGNLVTSVKKHPVPIKFEDAIKKMVKQVVVAGKTKKKVKGTVIKKKKAKKKIEPTSPLRPNPLKLGDKVWTNNDYGDKYSLQEIVKCTPPRRTYGEYLWTYNTKDGSVGTEESFIPDKFFTLNANDVSHLKKAEFEDALNKTFDEKVLILAVYRKGQKRPWAYYVIPDKSLIWKEITHEYWPYGQSVGYNSQTKVSTVFIKPIEQMTLRLIPISGAPQEILTYLGLHVYNRKWVRIHGAHTAEAEALV